MCCNLRLLNGCPPLSAAQAFALPQNREELVPGERHQAVDQAVAITFQRWRSRISQWPSVV